MTCDAYKLSNIKQNLSYCSGDSTVHIQTGNINKKNHFCILKRAELCLSSESQDRHFPICAENLYIEKNLGIDFFVITALPDIYCI